VINCRGEKFRPTFVRLGELRSQFTDVPFLLLTATCTHPILQFVMINFIWKTSSWNQSLLTGISFRFYNLLENEWREQSVLYILQKSIKIIIISKKLFNYNTENYVMSVETGLLILLNQSTNHNTACI